MCGAPFYIYIYRYVYIYTSLHIYMDLSMRILAGLNTDMQIDILVRIYIGRAKQGAWNLVAGLTGVNPNSRGSHSLYAYKERW